MLDEATRSVVLKQKVELSKLADLEYHGSNGTTKYCLDAIARLIQFGDRIEKAWLLSGPADEWNCRTHAFLLTLKYELQVVIGTGFSSGYGGEGCRGLSKALQLLERHQAEVDEYEIDTTVMNRLEHRCLLQTDIDSIETSSAVRPNRYYDYIYWDKDLAKKVFGDKDLNALFPPIVPLAIVDVRLLDLAQQLEEYPDETLFKGFRRLETIVRSKHSDLEGQAGHNLFTAAFLRENSFLHWPDITKGETEGRAQLFIGAFKAYRNERIHNEPETHSLHDSVREFLLLNELFILESQAILKIDEGNINKL